jgi:hypothetical protein
MCQPGLAMAIRRADICLKVYITYQKQCCKISGNVLPSVTYKRNEGSEMRKTAF